MNKYILKLIHFFDIIFSVMEEDYEKLIIKSD